MVNGQLASGILILALMAPGCALVETLPNRSIAAIENAIKQLEEGRKTFDEIKEILSGLKNNLDNEVYKRQVDELIHTTGQVAQIGGESTADFTRARIIEDFINLKRLIKGQEPLPRTPVLANYGLDNIDFTNKQRKTVKVVGWNLDIAGKNPEKYKVIIENQLTEKDPVEKREIPADIYISYQGQYAVTIDISSSGVPLRHGDKRISFLGYNENNAIPIVNSNLPPSPKKITAIMLNVGTTWDDKDKEIIFHYTIHRRNGQQIAGISKGGGEVWPDPSDQKPHWRQFIIPIDKEQQFPVDDRFNYVLHVKYTSFDGDPKWNGRFRADALVDDGNPIPVLSETNDFNFGHRGDGNPDDRDFDFNK